MRCQGRIFEKGFSDCLSSHHCEGGWRYHRGTVWLLQQQGSIFDALVEESYTHLLSAFRNVLDDFSRLPIEQQPERMGTVSQACMEELLLYMFNHREAFHLLLLCSEGTRYSSMKEELVQLEVNATHRYYLVLEKLGMPAPQIDPRLEHILVTGMINAYFEMIIHDMPLADAKQYLRELHSFYSAGWLKIMGQ